MVLAAGNGYLEGTTNVGKLYDDAYGPMDARWNLAEISYIPTVQEVASDVNIPSEDFCLQYCYC